MIYKLPKGHLVFRFERGKTHSLDEVIYVEKPLETKGKLITVYNIFGEIFAAEKTDSLSTAKKRKRLLSNVPENLREITLKIGRMTQLNFYGVDFIEDFVIDLNPYPNPFFYDRVIEIFKEYIISNL